MFYIVSSRTARATQKDSVSKNQKGKKEYSEILQSAGVGAHAFNPSTWETETGDSL